MCTQLLSLNENVSMRAIKQLVAVDEGVEREICSRGKLSSTEKALRILVHIPLEVFSKKEFVHS